MTKVYNVGVEATLDVIGGKWKPVILCDLHEGPMRTSELPRAIPNVTQKVLTEQLRDLEHDGIVTRKVFNEVPPRVVYGLTEHGQNLSGLLEQICQWGEEDVRRRAANGESVVIRHLGETAPSRDELLG